MLRSPLPIDKLKQHGVGDVKLGELVESGWWHDDLAAVIEMFALGARHHDGGIAAVVFIEAFAGASTADLLHVIHHGVVAFVEMSSLVGLGWLC